MTFLHPESRCSWAQISNSSESISITTKMTCPTQSHNIGIVAAATICPKCGAERAPGADSWARSGLLVSRWSGFEQPQSLGPPAVGTLWAGVEADWDNGAPHARFLDQAAVLGALDLAAARYRRRLLEGSDVRAQAGLDRAVRLAL